MQPGHTTDTERWRRPSAQRIGGGLILLLGAAVLAANALDRFSRFPDEEVVGAFLLLFGVAALVLPPGRGLRGWQAVVTVFIVLGALGEAGLRWNNWQKQRGYAQHIVHWVDDPELKYDFLPNRQVCPQGKTNGLGMIDVPHLVENPEHKLRVACLGDSVGGDCELFSDNVCVDLEKALPEAGEARPVEALNFSIPGYNTMQEARMLELKAEQFQPDVLVVLYVLNDPYPELAISNYLPGHLKFVHMLYAKAAAGWQRLFGQANPEIQLYYELHQNERAWKEVVVRGFDRIQSYAASRKIPVVLAIFPQFIHGKNDLLPRIYSQVSAEAQRHGFIPVDLSTEAYANVPVDTLLKPSQDATHPNARAHELAAKAIARGLMQARPVLRGR